MEALTNGPWAVARRPLCSLYVWPRAPLLRCQALCVAFQIVNAEARKTGKTYLVVSTPRPPAVYVFACDHPDARNPAINIMIEPTQPGERIRRPAIRSATRH
jgi:hypothetical protein